MRIVLLIAAAALALVVLAWVASRIGVSAAAVHEVRAPGTLPGARRRLVESRRALTGDYGRTTFTAS